MSYYIKGNKERSVEVIGTLIEHGGKNPHNIRGDNKNTIYYIGKDNIICSLYDNCDSAYIITKYLTELTLPEKKEWEPKFKLGDYYRSKSTSNIGEITGIDSDGFYIVHLLGHSPGGMKNEENIEPWEPKRGERVLVRNSINPYWREAIFSFIVDGYFSTVGGMSWRGCIPFDENKLGKVTD